MSTDPFQSPGEVAAGALAPETDIFTDPDIAEFGRALTETVRGVLGHPLAASGAGALFASRMAQVPGAALAKWLPGTSMAGTFDVLRANDLIFNYVASNWLMGQQPPAFDILAWNSDATRMPAAMHSFYLRNFYVENKLAKSELEVGGRLIQLSEIKHDTYIVSAENDHIVPWRSAYRTTQLLAGSNRFVLSSGGHIAGIVNPPSPKGWYEVSDELPADADEWRAVTTRKPAPGGRIGPSGRTITQGR